MVFYHNGLGQGGFVWEPPKFQLDPKCFQALIDIWIKYFWLDTPIGAQWGAVLMSHTLKKDLKITPKLKILYIAKNVFFIFFFKDIILYESIFWKPTVYRISRCIYCRANQYIVIVLKIINLNLVIFCQIFRKIGHSERYVALRRR